MNGLLWVLTGLGIGIALASAPGAVQAVLLVETVRGGVRRGLAVLAGSTLTSAVLLISLALGFSVVAPSGFTLGVLKVIGGLYLLVLASHGLRSAKDPSAASAARGGLPAPAVGSLTILLNPAGWIFLGAVASPLFASASQSGGVPIAVATAIALIAGLGAGDLTVVLIGGLGVRQAQAGLRVWVRRILAAVLATLALWLIVTGSTP